MKKWIIRKTIFLILLILVIYSVAASGLSGFWSINNTVSWAWDTTNIKWWLGVLIWIGFILGYALLAVFEVATSLVLSSLQLLLLICSLLIVRFFEFTDSLILTLLILTNLVFILNLVVSVRRKFLNR